MTTETVKVWDIAVRVFHWSLVLFFFIAYVSGEEAGIAHEYSSYAVLALVGFRIVWGLVGTKYARFSNFIYSPKTTRAYLVSMLKLKPKHYIGHNPAGGWMTITLLVFLLLTVWTGLEAYAAEGKGLLAKIDMPIISIAMANGDDRDHDGGKNGNEFWEEAHEVLSHFTLFLVIVHILGVLVSSAIQRENLVRAMITGKKKKPAELLSDQEDT